ncbi:MAG: stage II sporulation protein R [Acetobacter sp.]|nr:stage II sporulation protein R [Bacteroides sp.]MCM1340569.1 stage II sporulation protein R [Acetobacter sp.]MCM1433309.1 stage II sporulation protein R [Clostridiales bacterium]
MRLKKIFIPIFIMTLIAAAIITPSIKTSESINQKILRLHILANSDSSEDQNLKLIVRDYILTNASDIFNGSTFEDNLDIANENTDLFENLANECLKNNGSNKTANVEVTKEFFNTRVYDDFILPAGNYNSLKITIGEGNGHNWWCIIFPSVCLSGCSQSMADYLSDDEMDLVSGEYTPKFKIVEIYEKLKNRLY